MNKYVLKNNKVTNAINSIIEESFTDLGSKISEILTAIEEANTTSEDLQDIIAINDVLAIRFDEILANHCRALIAACSKLEMPITQNIA